MATNLNMKSVLSRGSLVLLLVPAVCLSLVGCGRTQAADPNTVLTVARDYRKTIHTSLAGSAEKPPDQPASNKDARGVEAEYAKQIITYLNEWDFDQLEKAAREARAGKERLEGGLWKLLIFYDALSHLPAGINPTETDWTNRLETLKQWISAKPESATARVALAEAYIGYAWAGRGSGYADKVSANGWSLFRERTQLAKSALLDAARLRERCPHWYKVMQEVALAEGWEKAQARELLEQATAFEPLYYPYYREHANFLLTKWYGDRGEAEAFADEVSNRLGGREGNYIYFEIASMVICQCNSDKIPMPEMSWPKIKQGYAALGQLYGVSPRKLNRFAVMAYVADDKPAAREAFARIANDWDSNVWMSSDSFQRAKAWATIP